MFNSRNNQYSALNKISKEDALKIVEQLDVAELQQLLELHNKENLMGFIGNACTRSMLITLLIRSSLTPDELSKYAYQSKMRVPIVRDTPDAAAGNS